MNISESLIATLETELNRLKFLTKDLLDSIKTKLITIKSLQKEQEYEAILEERKRRPQPAAEKMYQQEGEESSLLNKLLVGGAGITAGAAAVGGGLFSGEANASVNRGNQPTPDKLEQRAISKEVSPEGKALLDAIALKESRGRYDIIVGEGSEKGLKESDKAANRSKGYEKAPATFSDYSKHPGIRGMRTTRGYSTAAGRYQFVESTWNAIASRYPDLNDFSPQNQDKAAWYLAQEEYLRDTGRDLQKDLETKDPKILANIESSLKNQWTSLTGGIEEGKGQSNEAFNRAYTEFLNTQTASAATSTDAEKIPEPPVVENPQAKIEPVREASTDKSKVETLADSKRLPKVRTITNNLYQETVVTQVAQQTVSESDTTVSSSLPSSEKIKIQYRNLA